MHTESTIQPAVAAAIQPAALQPTAAAPTPEPPIYQCRHILPAGHRCGSRALRGEAFCYYHHTTRKPLPRTAGPRLTLAPDPHPDPHAPFDLSLPEDRAAIQQSIGHIIQRIAANQLDPRRAGLLLYALQIASSNLPKPAKDAQPLKPLENSSTTQPSAPSPPKPN